MARGKNNVVEGIIPLPAEKLLTTKTDEDKIVEYLNDPNPNAKLSKKLDAMLKRVRLAYDVYAAKGSINAAVNMLVKPDRHGNTISRRTARRDIQMAMRIYSDGLEHNRKINVDLELKGINEEIQLARLDKDWKAVARLRELKKKYIDDHMGDSMAEAYRNLQPNTILIGKFPELLKTPLPDDDTLLRNLEALKKKKVSDYLDAEEISFETDGE